MLGLDVLEGWRHPAAIKPAAKCGTVTLHGLRIGVEKCFGLLDIFGVLVSRDVRIVNCRKFVHVPTIIEYVAAGLALGVETADGWRGRGLAGEAVSEWAREVRADGRIPLYSTSWSNDASRAVAEKLGLVHFGSDLHIR